MTRSNAALALICLAGCAPSPAAQAPQAEDAVTSCSWKAPDRTAWLEGSLSSAVTAFESAHGGACPPMSTKDMAVHELGDYAMAKLATGGDARLAKSALACLFTFQSPSGVFPFHFGDPPSLSDNSTEFAMLPLATIAAWSAIPASELLDLAPKIKASLDAIEQHAVCPSYTNICLMQSAEMLALGRALARSADPDLAAYGRAREASGKARLDDFIALTRASGVHEFDSPTYTQIDLETVLVALQAATDDATRAKVRAISDYLWSDLAASTFAPRGSLAGPESRSYDFVMGLGGLTIATYLEGLRADVPSQGADTSKAPLLFNAKNGGYRPPASAMCLGSPVPREVTSTYGIAPGQERYVYVSRAFSLGSASADYGKSLGNAQDLLVRGELPSPKSAAITVLPDYLDAPGSEVQAGDFKKVTHLLASPAAAQSKGQLLVLFRVPADDPKYVSPSGAPVPLVNLATNVLFPADADEIWIDGAKGDARAARVLGPKSTIALRVGAGAIAFAVVDAGGLECPGAPAASASEIDVKPLAGATAGHGPSARLAIYHTKTLPSDTSKLRGCFARSALLFAGADCAGATCARDLGARVQAAAAQASVAWDPASGDWQVTGQLDAKLHVHRKNDAILARHVDGAPIHFAPLAVNGAPVVLSP